MILVVYLDHGIFLPVEALFFSGSAFGRERSRAPKSRNLRKNVVAPLSQQASAWYTVTTDLIMRVNVRTTTVHYYCCINV